MTLALELYRSAPRYLASRTIGGRMPGLLAGPIAPLRLVHRRDPEPPAPDWTRVRPVVSGICGSDLATLSGSSSFYFTGIVSMPFVPGHEVVGVTLDDVNGIPAGSRIVLDPVLGCEARGIEPMCVECKNGEYGLCERVTGGHVSAGLQTGYCASTGGGWSEGFVAHRSQLHVLPEGMDDLDAVLVEPLACAIHAVRRANVPRDATVLVAGAGTVGLLTILALREFTEAGRVVTTAKYAGQADMARALGATDVVRPGDAVRSVRRITKAFTVKPERTTPFLLGGVDVAFDAAGSPSTLDVALKTVRARGTVVLAGMPAAADLTPAWYRELTVVGAYSGAGAFDDAVPLAAEARVGRRLVRGVYPLSRWREALDHALGAGKLGTLKVAFDPRLD